MDKPKLFSSAEAADYLGIHIDTLRYHIYEQKRLAADYVIGRDLAFLQSTLDDFKAIHQNAQGLTMQEAADLLKVERHWIRNQHLSGKIQPVGKRGKFWVFSAESIEALRPLAEQHRTRKQND